MSTQAIVDAIESKHSDDVVVFECKNGPTHTGNSLLRMDCWVMPKSWVKPAITVYEIKTDRRDFVRDTKWPRYLEYCNLLYFAAPKGLIKADELPPEAGLMELVGSRLVIRKKSMHRTNEINPDVFRYILMCRIKVERADPLDERLARIENIKKLRADGKDLGWAVAGELRKTTSALERANLELQYLRADRERGLKMIEELKKAGGDPYRDRGITYELKKVVDSANRALRILGSADETATAQDGGVVG